MKYVRCYKRVDFFARALSISRGRCDVGAFLVLVLLYFDLTVFPGLTL
jgi:hypothetical protein